MVVLRLSRGDFPSRERERFTSKYPLFFVGTLQPLQADWKGRPQCTRVTRALSVNKFAGESAERIAVVRDAFAESTDIHRPLSSLLAALGGDSLAVAAEASDYHRRLVVDEYKLGLDGQYVLQNVATDLYRSVNPPPPPSASFPPIS